MRWLLVLVLAAVSLIGPPAVAQVTAPQTPDAVHVPAPQLWYIATAPQADSANMWTADAPWQEAARKVKVLVIVHERVSQASIPELIQIRDFAKAHHMQIDLSTEAVAKTNSCGAEEGYTWPGENAGAAQLLFSLGFQIDWVDMDGPMNAGHYDTGPQGCQYSIANLVPSVASTLQGVFALYPNARLIDSEPLPSLELQPTWLADVDAFHAGLAQVLGLQGVSMQADVDWNNPAWPQAMVDLRDHLHEQNQLLSIIYDPNPMALTDPTAISTTVDNIEAVEGRFHVIPDIAVIESWDPNPVNAMPETSPNAETWLIDRYRRPYAVLTVHFVGQGAAGTLTTMQGKPIANATINGYQPGVDLTQPLPVIVSQGTVPANATSAILMLRINTECGCNGMNHVLFSTLQYQETAGGTSSFNFSWPTTYQTYGGTIVDGQEVGGAVVNEVFAPPGQSFAPNSNAFPVTAGAQYNFTVPAGTIGGMGWFGYAAIAWIDANGNGTGARQEVAPPPGKALVSTATTAADGSFALSRLPRNVDGTMPVTVEFDGMNGTYRSTVWTPLK